MSENKKARGLVPWLLIKLFKSVFLFDIWVFFVIHFWKEHLCWSGKYLIRDNIDPIRTAIIQSFVDDQMFSGFRMYGIQRYNTVSIQTGFFLLFCQCFMFKMMYNINTFSSSMFWFLSYIKIYISRNWLRLYPSRWCYCYVMIPFLLVFHNSTTVHKHTWMRFPWCEWYFRSVHTEDRRNT